LFDAETAQTDLFAKSIEEWADKILKDYAVLTGFPLLRPWPLWQDDPLSGFLPETIAIPRIIPSSRPLRRDVYPKEDIMKKLKQRRPLTEAQTRALMNRSWKKIALIHADMDCPDWVSHQIIRFVYEGYSHQVGPLLTTLRRIDPDSKRTMAIEMLLEAERESPSEFAGTIPKGQLYKYERALGREPQVPRP
jgi:hypothetical protein